MDAFLQARKHYFDACDQAVKDGIGFDGEHTIKHFDESQNPLQKESPEPSEMCKAVGNLGEYIVPENVDSKPRHAQPEKSLGQIARDTYAGRESIAIWTPENEYEKLWEKCAQAVAQAVVEREREMDKLRGRPTRQDLIKIEDQLAQANERAERAEKLLKEKV